MEIGTRSPFEASSFVFAPCALAPVHRSNTAELARVLVMMDPWRTLGYRAEPLSRYLSRNDPALHRFVVYSRDIAAGCICIRHPWLMGPFLEILAVFPDFQRRGLGATLVRWLEEEVRSSCRNIWTTVSSFNSNAAGFYEHMGFVQVGPLKDLIKAGFDESLLRKTLDFTAPCSVMAGKTS